jgi:integrase
MMERKGVLRWDDDIRQLPEQLGATKGETATEAFATKWEKRVLAAAPPGTLVRWKRGRSGKKGVKGSLVLVDSRPQCEGFTVKVRGAPRAHETAGRRRARDYPGYQRRALEDGTAITTVRLAWDAYAELQADVAALERVAENLTAQPQQLGGTEGGDATVSGGKRPTGQQAQAGMRTRGGASLGGVPVREFSAAERTLGAVIARMEATPGAKTTRGVIRDNRHIAARVLTDDTRLDVLTRDDYQVVYDELAGLRNMTQQRRRGHRDQVISAGRRKSLWYAFLMLLDYARREGWMQHEARDIDKGPRVKGRDVAALSHVETLQFERFVTGVAASAKEAVRAGTLTQVTPRRGRVWSMARHWSRLRLDAMTGASDGAVREMPAAQVGGVALVGVQTGVRYFASALAAYVLLATGVGPRPGELDALCWNSVDLEAGTITWERRLTETRQALPGQTLERTTPGCKGTHGVDLVSRKVLLSAEMCAALRQWRVEWAALVLAMGWQVPLAKAGGVVFPSASGGIMDQTFSNKLWKGAERAAGITVTRPHGVRHTISTENAYAHVPAVVTAACLGHSVQVELQYYMVPGADRAAEAFAKTQAAWRREYAQRFDVNTVSAADERDVEGVG